MLALSEQLMLGAHVADPRALTDEMSSGLVLPLGSRMCGNQPRRDSVLWRSVLVALRLMFCKPRYAHTLSCVSKFSK